VNERVRVGERERERVRVSDRVQEREREIERVCSLKLVSSITEHDLL
jgi:hypothetical protein